MTVIHPPKPRDGAKAPRKLPRGESQEERKARFQKIFKRLHKLYPKARTALEFSNPYELVVATILSAQTTDKQVNIVMPYFRKVFPTPKKLAEADVRDINHAIRSIGFHNAKARHLKAMAIDLVEKFGGKVPQTQEELMTLKGVGRKTANVVLGDAFNKPVGIAVDTHVMRLTGRLGLTKNNTPEKIEQDLLQLAKPTQLVLTSHVLIYHGRETCIARKPRCSECVVTEYCPSAGYPGSA